MHDVRGDLWGYADYGFADVAVITTNGFVTNAGECVMGRGCAKQARDMFPGLAKKLGAYIQRYGNRAFNLGTHQHAGPVFTLVSMPVKHHWRERADTALIECSARQIVEMADKYKWESIVVPRPGCGNGGLAWEVVKPLVEPIFDDRFTVVSF